MRALIQRVSEASVTIDGKITATIGRGVLVYLAVHEKDTGKDLDWTVQKVAKARIFENPPGKLSDSVSDVGGEILVVSQFTLYGDFSHGNRPDMTQSMRPPGALEYYENFTAKLREVAGLTVKTGEFGARMKITSANDGPVTLMIDSLA